MGQSSQAIQGQRDQLVISQVPGEGEAERDTEVRALLTAVPQPSRGHCLNCSLDVMLKWGWMLHWGQEPLEINTAVLGKMGDWG